MKQNNKYRGLVLSSTFVGLVCGLVLTHYQVYAAQTQPVNNPVAPITAVAAVDPNLDRIVAVNPDSSDSATDTGKTTNVYNILEANATANRSSVSEPITPETKKAAFTTNTGKTTPAAVNTLSTGENNNLNSQVVTNSTPHAAGNTVTASPNAGSSASTNSNSSSTKAPIPAEHNNNIIAHRTWGTSKWEYIKKVQNLLCICMPEL